jgi:hypothetical protein
VQNTSSVLVPAPENIARVLEKFRNDIRSNAFTISPHANMRMVSRAISHTEMYDAVVSGQTVTGRRIPDYIGGRFFHKGLFVAVYSPFGDLGATPCVVSVCRDGELDDYEITDLPSVTALQNLRQQVEELSQRVNQATEALTIEELEDLLARRKAQREAELAEAAAREREEKMQLRGAMLSERARLDEEILALEVELGLMPPRDLSQIPTVTTVIAA